MDRAPSGTQVSADGIQQAHYDPNVDQQRKLALLDEQIEMAQGGNPEKFSEWRNKTEVVIRTVMGDGSKIHKKFEAVSYSPTVWYSGIDSSGYRPAGVKSVVSILEAAKLEVTLAAEVEVAIDLPDVGRTEPGSRVFIVHGHDEANKYQLLGFLNALTGVEPVILHKQANNGRVLIEKFEQSAAGTGYAVVLLTADDLGRAKHDVEEKPRGRQNVVFEMGFFFGAFGRSRVAVLFEEGVEIPGDAVGLVYIPLDKAGGWKSKLATEIESAGIDVSWKALSGG